MWTLFGKKAPFGGCQKCCSFADVLYEWPLKALTFFTAAWWAQCSMFSIHFPERRKTRVHSLSISMLTSLKIVVQCTTQCCSVLLNAAMSKNVLGWKKKSLLIKINTQDLLENVKPNIHDLFESTWNTLHNNEF